MSGIVFCMSNLSRYRRLAKEGSWAGCLGAWFAGVGRMADIPRARLVAPVFHRMAKTGVFAGAHARC